MPRPAKRGPYKTKRENVRPYIRRLLADQKYLSLREASEDKGLAHSFLYKISEPDYSSDILAYHARLAEHFGIDMENLISAALQAAGTIKSAFPMAQALRSHYEACSAFEQPWAEWVAEFSVPQYPHDTKQHHAS